MVIMFSAADSEDFPRQISKETIEDTTLSEKDTGTRKLAYWCL